MPSIDYGRGVRGRGRRGWYRTYLDTSAASHSLYPKLALFRRKRDGGEKGLIVGLGEEDGAKGRLWAEDVEGRGEAGHDGGPGGWGRHGEKMINTARRDVERLRWIGG